MFVHRCGDASVGRRRRLPAVRCSLAAAGPVSSSFGTHEGADAGHTALDHPPVRPGGEVLPAQAGRHRHPAGRERVTYGDWADRTRRLGGVLDTLGISDDGRVATFAWNTARHLELYFAAPCTGRVLHTLNIRLFPEQLTYIVNHADDEVIFVDRSLLGPAGPAVADVRTPPSSRADGRRQGRHPHRSQRPRTARLRGPVGGRVAGRVPHRRRAPRGEHVLHERHDGQPEGRRLHASQHVPAHDGRAHGRLARRPRVRRDPPGRADVPRQRLGSRPCRRGRRLDARDARPRPVGARPRRPDRRRARSPSPRACRRSGCRCCPS